jgi:chaperonin GroEL (HSP60 family)
MLFWRNEFMPESSPVISAKYDHFKGVDAWRQTIEFSLAAADRIRSSLGPNGAYKLVTYNKGPEKVCKMTKDPVSVLEELTFQHPILCVLAESAKMHREEVGDGVTTFVVLLSAFLREAMALMSKKVHPNVILDGYFEAKTRALSMLDALARSPENAEKNNLLKSIDCGRGILTDELQQMIAQTASLALNEGRFNKEKLQFIRVPGAASSETKLIRGIAIKKMKCHPNMPNSVEKPKIALISGRFGPNRVEVKMKGTGPFNLKFEIESPEKMDLYAESCKKPKLDSLKNILPLCINVVFCQQPIDQCVKSKLLEYGVLTFECVERKDLAKLSLATGANVVSNPSDLTAADVGFADKLETDKVGLERIVTLHGCLGATFLLRGSTPQTMDELEMAIYNSLLALSLVSRGGKMVSGGGAVEATLAKDLDEFSRSFSGKKQLAIAAFGKALLDIPACLAQNNGLDSLGTIAELKRLHSLNLDRYGVGSYGCSEDVCIELADSKRTMFNRAYEVLSLMLRIDEQLMYREVPKFHKK